MIDLLKKLFGFGVSVDYAALLKNGATVLDVRSPAEYAGGHIKGSINIAVDSLSGNLSKLSDKNKPIIVYCASGMRSGVAKNILTTNGYTAVYNGGGFHSLQQKLFPKV